MKILFFIIYMAGTLAVSACAVKPAEDILSTATATVESSAAVETPEKEGTIVSFTSHQFDNLTIDMPVYWTSTTYNPNSGYRTEFRDTAIPPVPWGDITAESFVSILVTTEEWALQGLTAQEYADYTYNGLSAEGKEKNILTIDGVEASIVTHERPYFQYKLTSIFIPHNGREYMIDIHYDAANENIAALVPAIIDSIKIAE